MTFFNPNRFPLILLTAIALLMSGCGGGGGQTAGGIGGTGSSLGPVSGFGSIILNGTEFATDNATVSIEGEIQAGKGDLSKIRVGQIVLVRGVYSNATFGTANEVIYLNNLEGPIADKNPVNNSFTSMGQTVLIDGDPVIGTKFVNATNLNDLNVNDIVEVSGSPDQRGNIVASYIEKKGTFTNGATAIEIKGNVSGLDTPASSFKIGALTITFDAAGATHFKNLTPGDLAQPIYIEVKGTTFSGNGALVATAVERINRPINPGERGDLQITGVTADCNAPCTEFTVEGQRVVTSAQIEFENGDATDLVDNRKVEIEATIDSLGRAVAKAVKFVKGSVQIEALADGPADVAAQTFSILGIEAKVSSVTKFKDALTLADIATGTPLKILGYRIGDTRIIVTQIESKSGATRLRGPLQSVDKANSQFAIQGVRITVDGATSFKDRQGASISFDTFFDTTPSGAIISVKGAENPDNQIKAIAAQNGEVEIQD